MTYKKSTQSLERLCLKLLSKNILLLQNDAQHLSPMLCHELYENREKPREKYPRSEYDIIKRLLTLPPNVFITPGTRKLEELNQFTTNIFEINPKILNVCHNLRHLDVSNMKFGKRILKQLVINNRKLETINFEDTFCSNSVLQAIGKYCRNLKRLNISQCLNFNDNGIHDLCNKNMKIIHLNVRTTEITTYGFLFALNNLPCLTTICYDYVLETIEAPQYKNRLLSKSILDIESPRVVIAKDGLLQQLSVAFPNLSIIELDITTMNEVLFLIDYFPQLERLAITITQQSHYFVPLNLVRFDKFREQIRPAFNIVNNLTHLSLWGIPSVDLVVIGRSCPCLKHFVVLLDGATDSASLNEPCPHVLFENLENLRVHNDFAPAREEFKLLLSNCSQLKQLSVDSTGSRVFSDELFKRLLESNPMKCVERIFLAQCPGITTKFLKRLMKMDNRLRILSVIKCKNVNESHLAKFADEKCFDIEIKFIKET